MSKIRALFLWINIFPNVNVMGNIIISGHSNKKIKSQNKNKKARNKKKDILKT